MKYVFLAFAISAIQAGAQGLPVTSSKGRHDKIVKLAQALARQGQYGQVQFQQVQKKGGSSNSKTDASTAPVEQQALSKLASAADGDILFEPVALVICAGRVSPQASSLAGELTMEDVATSEAALLAIVALGSSLTPGSEDLSDEAFANLLTNTFKALYLTTIRKCIVNFSQRSALEAQNQGRVSTFLKDFDSQVIQATKSIIAGWRKSNSNLSEDYQTTVKTKLAEIMEAILSEGQTAPRAPRRLPQLRL